jgi:hypothetical protein
VIGQDLYAMPTGRRVEESAMSVRTLPRASAKVLERARRTWPEAMADDFEIEGKLFRDKGSGVVYRRVPGDPQLGGAGREDVSTWFVSHDDSGDGIVYLIVADNPGSVTRTVFGEIGGRLAAAHEGVMR